MTQPPVFCQHNHQSCIDQALMRAQQVCAGAGVKLTPLRLQVFKLIWQNHKPLGAYALMALLEGVTAKRVAPPTVYRALDFLLEHGLIHRVHSLNAYLGCTQPGHGHTGGLLICQLCGQAQELQHTALSAAIEQAAQSQAFRLNHWMLEIVGHCAQCQGAA